MNKTEFVHKLAETADVSTKVAATVLSAFEEVVTQELAAGKEVKLMGFGSFHVADVAERKGRNPKTGEALIIEAHKAPKFKAGSELKKAVNK